MKKLLLSAFCLILANFVFAQVDSTTTKTTKTVKTTTTTITTTTTEENGSKSSKRETRLPTEKKNILKLSTLGINYERVLNDKVSIQFNTIFLFSGQSYSSSTNNTQTFKTQFYGFGVGAEMRYYTKSTFNGFFVAFSPRYQNYNFIVENGAFDNNGGRTDAKANWNAYNIALLVGSQKIYKNNISLEIYGGPAAVGGVLEITKGNRDAFTFFGTGINTGVTLRAGASIGWAF